MKAKNECYKEVVMKFSKIFVLRLFFVFSLTYAISPFAEDSHLKSGAALHLTGSSEISDSEKSLICMPFEGGHIESAKENGIELFGSFEKYYANLYRIDCANSPTPIYHVIDFKIESGEIGRMLVDLDKLDRSVAAKLLNKPRKGRRKETVLDLLDRTIEGMIADGTNVTMMIRMRSRFVENGAKKFSEMTSEELASYE